MGSEASITSMLTVSEQLPSADSVFIESSLLPVLSEIRFGIEHMFKFFALCFCPVIMCYNGDTASFWIIEGLREAEDGFMKGILFDE